MRNRFIVYSLLAWFLLSACCHQSDKLETKPMWQEVLKEKLPLLGHRNWIVVTDMAYPLQSKPGILTLYAEEPYEEVLNHVRETLEKAPHVYGRVSQDQELSWLKEELCPGIDAFRQEVGQVLSGIAVTTVPHEQLIARLDSASQLFQVVIIKTNLAKPYTSTFFELDCKYWDAEKQKDLVALHPFTDK